MSTLTRENIPNLCRSCLTNVFLCKKQPFVNEKEQQQPALYHLDRVKDLSKWMAIINPLEDVIRLNNKQQYNKYPKYVCPSCYEIFKNVNDFKDMVIESFNALTKSLVGDNADALTQGELAIKLEPIDDNADNEAVEDNNAQHTKQPQVHQPLKQSEMVTKSVSIDYNTKQVQKPLPQNKLPIKSKLINDGNGKANAGIAKSTKHHRTLAQDELVIKVMSIDDYDDEEFVEKTNTDNSGNTKQKPQVQETSTEYKLIIKSKHKNDRDVVVPDNLNNIKEHTLTQDELIIKLISIDDYKAFTEETNADDSKGTKELDPKQSFTQGELIVKQEPIDDDEKFVQDANADKEKNLENDWNMEDGTNKATESGVHPVEPSTSSLRSSIGEEGNLKSKPYYCTICRTNFKYKMSYERHAQMHLGISRAFECDFCHRIFPQYRDLYKHVLKFHRQNKCKCNNCIRSFQQMNTHTKHSKEFHNGNSSTLPDVIEINKNTIVTCDICNIDLKLTSLNQHILTVHDDIKPFAGEYCPKTYAAKYTFKLHTG